MIAVTIPPNADPQPQEKIHECRCPSCGEMNYVPASVTMQPVDCARCHVSFTPVPWADNNE